MKRRAEASGTKKFPGSHAKTPRAERARISPPLAILNAWFWSLPEIESAAFARSILQRRRRSGFFEVPLLELMTQLFREFDFCVARELWRRFPIDILRGQYFAHVGLHA